MLSGSMTRRVRGRCSGRARALRGACGAALSGTVALAAILSSTAAICACVSAMAVSRSSSASSSCAGSSFSDLGPNFACRYCPIWPSSFSTSAVSSVMKASFSAPTACSCRRAARSSEASNHAASSAADCAAKAFITSGGRSGNRLRSKGCDMRIHSRSRQERPIKQRPNRCLSYPAAVGGATRCAMTRRQSKPSNKASNCARDNRIVPSCTLGQAKLPCSRTL